MIFYKEDILKKILILVGLAISSLFSDVLQDADKLYSNKSFKEAVKVYEKACDANLSKGCYRLAFMYENKQKVKQDFKKAFDLYEKSCKLGSAKGCYKIAACYDVGGILKVNKDFKKAENYYKKSCDGGFGLACYNLGSLYQYSLDVDKNENNMEKSYKEACQEGAVLGCYKLAHFYESKTDIQKAKKWFKIGCDKEDTQACFRLVDIYIKELSNLEPKSFKKEFKSYKKRCDSADTMGCYKLAAMYSTGRGVKQSYKNAKDVFIESCNMGDNASCIEGLMMIESGF